MSAKLIDYETILSGNEHWSRLDEEWGTPIDLETEEELYPPTHIQDLFSTFDLRKPTFDSGLILRKRTRKYKKMKSSQTNLNYAEFMQNIDKDTDDTRNSSKVDKDFYFVGGQIISAVSVNEICERIDDVFQSVEKLCATTSTVRVKKNKRSAPRIPDIVECSFSTSNLSFDDTAQRDEKEKSDGDDVSRYIDELFDELNATVASLHLTKSREMINATLASLHGMKSREMSLDQLVEECDEARDSVTTLVKKFTNVLKSPAVKCSPRRQRQCCQRFKELADFWKTHAVDNV